MVDIIKAQPAHVHSIRRLLQQLGYDSQTTELVSPLSVHDPHSEVFVAISQSNVIALMSLIYFHYFPTQQSLCRITAIVVDKNLRNCGIGKKLIEFAANQAQAHSCAQLEVTTSLARESTQACYEHMGFTKASYRYYFDIAND